MRGAGEGAAANGSEPRLVQIDLPLDGRGPISIPASDIISPILSMWLTLVLMYTGAVPIMLLALKAAEQQWRPDISRSAALPCCQAVRDYVFFGAGCSEHLQTAFTHSCMFCLAHGT